MKDLSEGNTRTDDGWIKMRYIVTMEYYSSKNEWNNVICSNIDVPRDCHTVLSKSDIERQITYGIAYMWNKKKWYRALLWWNLWQRLLVYLSSVDKCDYSSIAMFTSGKAWEMWSLFVQTLDSQLASLFYLAQPLTTCHCLSFQDCQQLSVSQAISDSWGIHDDWSMWAVKDHSLAYRRKAKVNKKKMKCKESYIKKNNCNYWLQDRQKKHNLEFSQLKIQYRSLKKETFENCIHDFK